MNTPTKRFAPGETVYFIGGPSWDISVEHELELEAEEWLEVTIVRLGDGGWDWVIDTGISESGKGGGLAPTERFADECQLRAIPRH